MNSSSGNVGSFVSDLHLSHVLYSDRVVKDTVNISLWIDWKSFDIKFLEDSLFILTAITMSQTKRKRRSVATQVRYEVDTSKNNFDEIIMLPNPDDSGSDNSGSYAEWDEEVPEITYKLACKTYTEDQAKLKGFPIRVICFEIEKKH